TYRQIGTTVCHRNTIKEAPLVDVIARKVQEQYLLARLRRAMEAAQDQSKPRPRDLSALRREIDTLDQFSQSAVFAHATGSFCVTSRALPGKLARRKCLSCRRLRMPARFWIVLARRLH
ncbi:MAG TPA: hypothetical protein VE890_10370, partial [Thermoguttaceae bacterium]|nr:hypothetical protein [Thermoguttaceae bacterium]